MSNKLILNLAGGMNRKASALITKDEECELLVNYHLDTVGALTKRKGYTTYASQPVAGKTVNGLFQFNDMSGDSYEQLMVADNAGGTNGVIYYNNAGTWTAAKSDDTAGKKSFFISFIDYVLRVNGYDVVASSTDGVTWGTTNCPATITPKFGAVFQDRIYVANGRSSNRSRFWFSSLPSSGSVTWDTANDWVDVNPDDGDQVTALENNGNRLLVFKNRALYRWTFGQVEPDRLIGVGTPSQASVRTNLDVGITFFANQNGVYGYSGNRPRLLSRKIQDIIEAVTDWTSVNAEVDHDHYYLSVGNISLEGRTYSNVVLNYHISLDAWSVYSLATKPTVMARLIETAPVENVYFGSTDGRTYKLLDGTSDNTAKISAEFRSKEYLLSYPETVELSNIDVFSTSRGTVQVMADGDRRDRPEVVGTLTERVTSCRAPNIRRTNSLRVYFKDSSTNAAVIEGFNIEYEKTVRRDENANMTRKFKDR
jgi:hypothetical protein